MSVDLAVEDRVALITINRPHVLNAMDADAYRGLSQAWIRVRDDDEILVAIITGAGDRSFTVGADLKSYVPDVPDVGALWGADPHPILNRGLRLWKPVVAAVNGYCIGGGLTLLLATDVRVAVEDAQFGLGEVQRGILPGNGGTQRFIRQVPYALAMEHLLTGERFSAQEAWRMGLINYVVPRAELMDKAFAIARRIAANAPLAARAIKELAIRSSDVDLETGLRLEQLTQALVRRSRDAEEGPRAFREKRPPRFEGR